MAQCPKCGKQFNADEATREQVDTNGTICCSYVCSTKTEIDYKARVEELEKHIRNMDQARMEQDELIKKLKQQKEALSKQLLLAADAVNQEAGFTGIGKALGVLNPPSQLHKATMECVQCGDIVPTQEVWEVWDHKCADFVWFACKKCKTIGTMRFVLENE